MLRSAAPARWLLATTILLGSGAPLASRAWAQPAAAEDASAVDAPTTAPAAGASADTFTEDQKRFETPIPAGWEKVAPNQPNMVMTLRSPAEGGEDKFRENVNCVAVPVPAEAAGMTLDAIVKEAVNELKTAMNANIRGEIAERKLGTERALAAEYDVEYQGNTYRSKQVYAMHNGTIYIVTYSATANTTPEMAGAANQIIDGWKFAD